jgi:hypothetical protein
VPTSFSLVAAAVGQNGARASALAGCKTLVDERSQSCKRGSARDAFSLSTTRETRTFAHGVFHMHDDNDARMERVNFSARNPRKDVFKEVDLRIRQRQSADGKLSYGAAMSAVFAADADLHRLYLDTVPPLRPNTNAQE